MLSHVKYRNSIFQRIENKSKYYLGTPTLKENGSEYSLLEKIYNSLFYSLLQYIHQLSMLSNVKYRNSYFTRIEEIWILSCNPNVKNKIGLNIICQKNIQCPILLCFGVYTPTPYALSCKIQKFHIFANQKKSKNYLGTRMLKAKYLWI